MIAKAVGIIVIAGRMFQDGPLDSMYIPRLPLCAHIRLTGSEPLTSGNSFVNGLCMYLDLNLEDLYCHNALVG